MWLNHSALAVLILMAAGSVATLLCRQPARRLRIIELTLGGCLLVPWLGWIPGYPQWAPGSWFADPPQRPITAASASSRELGARSEMPRSSNHENTQSSSSLPSKALSETASFQKQQPSGSLPKAPNDSKSAKQTWHAFTAWFNAIEWRSWIAGGYLIGAVSAVLWWLAGVVGLMRFIGRARPASQHCHEQFAQIAGRRGRRVRLLVSRQACQPFAAFWGRPVIVLPENLCHDERAIRWALAHEWSHIERRDFSIGLMVAFVRVLYFYQPLLWWLRRELRLCQDYLADAQAGRQTNGPEDYAEFLMARAVMGSFSPTFVGLSMGFRKSELYRRVIMLVQGNPLENRAPRRWTLPVACVAFGLIAAVAALINTQHSQATDQPPSTASKAADDKADREKKSKAEVSTAKENSQTTPESPTIEQVKVSMKIVNDKDEPLQGVTITPIHLHSTERDSLWMPKLHGDNHPVTTNAEGVAVLACPRYAVEKQQAFEVTVLLKYADYPETRNHVPIVGDRTVRLVMPRGATIRLSGYLETKDRPSAEIYPLFDNYKDFSAKAKESLPNGGMRWIGPIAPGTRYFRLVAFPENGPAWFSEVTTFEAKNGETLDFDLQLRPGLRLEGKFDASVPRPVKHGRICARIYDLPGNNGRLNWTVDAEIAEDGTFLLKSVPHDPQIELTAVCEGFISKSAKHETSGMKGIHIPQSFLLKESMEPITIAMEPSAKCEVLVVDKDNKPLEGVDVRCAATVFFDHGGGRIFALPWDTDATRLRPVDTKSKEDLEQAFASQMTALGYRRLTNADGIAVLENLQGHPETVDVWDDHFEIPLGKVGPKDHEWTGRDLYVELVSGQTSHVTAKVQPKGADLREDTPEEREQRKLIYDPAADSKADITAALQKAKQENKRVMLLFGDNWCSWCHRLHKILSENDVLASLMREHYELVMVNVDNYRDLLTTYDKDKTEKGFPFITILDADGNVLRNQNTNILEKGDGYNIDRIRVFLQMWSDSSNRPETPEKSDVKSEPTASTDASQSQADSIPDKNKMSPELWELIKPIQGVFRLKACHDDAHVASLFLGQEDPRNLRFFVTNDVFVVWNGTQAVKRYQYALVGPHKPNHAIDFSSEGHVFRGIYSWDVHDNILQIAFGSKLEERHQQGNSTVTILYPQPECLQKPVEKTHIAANTPAIAKILNELAKPTQMDFTETPLKEAMQYFSEYHQIKIDFDRQAFTEASVKPETPITMKVKDVTLNAALVMILSPLGLDYDIAEGRVVITTEKKAVP
jgi:beta-lactamase regulating signal transducer with metallopeptidase domain